MVSNESIEKELNKLLKKAIKKNEVPIAAIITYKGKIIAKAYNKVEKNNNFMNHAEILAIKKAMKKIKNWRLCDCKLFVSLEPCSMCKSIIKKSRIKSVYYFSKQNKELTELTPDYYYLKNENYSIVLKNFFKEKRNNKFHVKH